jgi:opacity protein-like surface antigen
MRSLPLVVSGFLALSTSFVVPALAADLGAPVEAAPLAAAEPQMEFGNSWYLRGDIAAVLETRPKISADLNQIDDSKRKGGYAFDVGFGYKFGSWFRTDVVAEYRQTHTRNGIGGIVQCPVPAGVAPVAANCDVNGYSKISHWNMLANAYVDLGNWAGLSPYVGAGAGFTHLTSRGSVNYLFNGAPYSFPVVNPVTGVATNVSFDQVLATRGKTNFAWNLLAGLGYALNEHAVLDLGYRYLNMGRFRGLNDVTGATYKKTLTSHEVRLGVRYMID